jgi:hypothetical protein
MSQVMFFRQFDPWYSDYRVAGLNKVGYVTDSSIVIYPRRSRITSKPLIAFRRRPHRLVSLSLNPRISAIETFFTQKYHQLYGIRDRHEDD